MKQYSKFLQHIHTHLWLKFFFVFTLLINFALFFIPDSVAAKSFRIDRIAIQARVLPDGNMYIDESRTYTFRGKFSWADYKLPLQGIGNVLDFSLNDENTNYRKSKSEEPGTYTVQSSEYSFYVRWHYQAENQTKTFTLHYLVTDVISVYQDVAELYYKFVGEENEMPVGQVTVNIQLPGQITSDVVKAWAHGPLWGGIRFEQNELVMDVDPLPARTYWEARKGKPAMYCQLFFPRKQNGHKRQMRKESGHNRGFWRKKKERKLPGLLLLGWPLSIYSDCFCCIKNTAEVIGYPTTRKLIRSCHRKNRRPL